MVEVKKLGVILGNQLFETQYYKDFPENIFMCEDQDLCTHFKYHKHKIIHFLASMREFKDGLTKKNVFYHELESRPHFFQALKSIVKKTKAKELMLYEVEDRFFEEAIINFADVNKLKVTFLTSPMFLCSREEFKSFSNNKKNLLMNSFYIQMRKKHQILIDSDGKPFGGSWSLDKDNRKKIPRGHNVIPFRPPPKDSKHIRDVSTLVTKYFSSHPGEIDNFWLPTKRNQALEWLDDFLRERFQYFGDFQDALEQSEPFLYHSVVSPMVNIGHLLPKEVVSKVIGNLTATNLNSVEGFIRQIIGWREFVRGVYQEYGQKQEQSNFFGHHKKLTSAWYSATTGVPPIDEAIRKAQTWGYCHHIERLMVLSNFMLLLKIHPKEVYKWFMEMFVDSSDWVMGPNVFGMGQFSDGGLFATKPYISGSNYLKKMGNYQKGEWMEAMDGLYWQFINRNRDFFKSNPRMSLMVKSLDKMDTQKKRHIFKLADDLASKLTH